ncbi:MAG: CHAD domain-containing protein [Bryobacteraceae bacterium]
MAFQFKRGEPIPRAIRRIVTEQLGSAADQLRNAAPSARDEAVHEARKSIKKVRAILRLMSGELGPMAAAGNTLLRDLARKLSALRDAAVLVETLDSLKGHLPDDIDPRLLAQVRARLVRGRAQVRRGPAATQLPATVAFALERASERVRAWPLGTTGFAALAPGLERAFHRGRKAQLHARKEPTAVVFHEWRKRVKDHWYHIRLLEGTWSEATRSYERSLKELETCLGDDHNLVVLRDRVAALENAPELAGLLAAVDNRQKQLRDRALHLGDRLYAQKPREFVRHAEELWDAWHAQREGPGRSPTLQRAAKRARASAA